MTLARIRRRLGRIGKRRRATNAREQQTSRGTEDGANSSGADPGYSDSGTRWQKLLDMLERRDKEMIDAWRDELNNLLIFAGLFSAVVTAFAVQSYPTLQQDPQDASVQLLSQISLQLASLTISSAFVNSTVPSLSSQNITSSFSPDAVNVDINALWVLSLTLSLGAAFFTIMVQQWLRQLPLPQRLSVREAVRLRQRRYQGLTEWQIPGIVLLLPLLIQIAVLFFLVGLYLLLWTLNSQVALAFTLVVGVGILLFGIPAFVPLISIRCPYKAPLIPTVLVVFQWLNYPFTLLVSLLGRAVLMVMEKFVRPSDNGYFILFVRRPVEQLNRYVSQFGRHIIVDLEAFWRERESSAMLKMTNTDTIDKDAILSGLSAIRDPAFADIMICIRDLPPSEQVHCALLVVTSCLGRYTEHDIADFNWFSPVNPEILVRADRLLSVRHRELMEQALPQNWETRDWLTEDKHVRSILVLLQVVARRSQQSLHGFFHLLARIRQAQKFSIIDYGSLAGRIPTVLMFNVCNSTVLHEEDVFRTISWAEELLSFSGPHHAIPFDIGHSEAVLASCGIALRAICQRSDIILYHQAQSRIESFLIPFAQCLRVHRDDVVRSILASNVQENICLVSLQAIRTIGECLVHLTKLDFLPLHHHSPLRRAMSAVHDICRSFDGSTLDSLRQALAPPVVPTGGDLALPSHAELFPFQSHLGVPVSDEIEESELHETDAQQSFGSSCARYYEAGSSGSGCEKWITKPDVKESWSQEQSSLELC